MIGYSCRILWRYGVNGRKHKGAFPEFVALVAKRYRSVLKAGIEFRDDQWVVVI